MFSGEMFHLEPQCIHSVGMWVLLVCVSPLRPPRLHSTARAHGHGAHLSGPETQGLLELRDMHSTDSVLELTVSFMFNFFMTVP